MKRPTVWITGASSGIGLAFARRYGQMGCRLILTARRADRLQALAEELGVPCRVLPADLSREDECRRVCRLVADEPIDLFINNAGLGTCGTFTETDPDRELFLMRVNVEAMHLLCKQVLRGMQDRGHGTILNVGSSAGLLPGGPYMAAYYASKAYVVSLTRSIAEELRQQHSPVYVCALCPGPVDTDFNEQAGVRFALKGISPAFCVDEALRGMLHRRIIIVPGAGMRLCMRGQKLLPARLLLPLVAHQQRKKLGPD